VIRQVAIVAQPFIPEAASRFLDLLAVPADQRDFTTLGGSGRLAPGGALPPPAPVFPRYVEPETKETKTK
jgi:methionyl-tRNA synthetase